MFFREFFQKISSGVIAEMHEEISPGFFFSEIRPGIREFLQKIFQATPSAILSEIPSGISSEIPTGITLRIPTTIYLRIPTTIFSETPTGISLGCSRCFLENSNRHFSRISSGISFAIPVEIPWEIPSAIFPILFSRILMRIPPGISSGNLPDIFLEFLR